MKNGVDQRFWPLTSQACGHECPLQPHRPLNPPGRSRGAGPKGRCPPRNVGAALLLSGPGPLCHKALGSHRSRGPRKPRSPWPRPSAFRSRGLGGRGVCITSGSGIQGQTCTPTVCWAPRGPAATSRAEEGERDPEGAARRTPANDRASSAKCAGPWDAAFTSIRTELVLALLPAAPGSPENPGSPAGGRGERARHKAPGNDVPRAGPRRAPVFPRRATGARPAQQPASAPTGRARPFRRRSRRRPRPQTSQWYSVDGPAPSSWCPFTGGPARPPSAPVRALTSAPPPSRLPLPHSILPSSTLSLIPMLTPETPPSPLPPHSPLSSHLTVLLTHSRCTWPVQLHWQRSLCPDAHPQLSPWRTPTSCSASPGSPDCSLY